jgi:hypothetical protein
MSGKSDVAGKATSLHCSVTRMYCKLLIKFFERILQDPPIVIFPDPRVSTMSSDRQPGRVVQMDNILSRLCHPNQSQFTSIARMFGSRRSP